MDPQTRRLTESKYSRRRRRRRNLYYPDGRSSRTPPPIYRRKRPERRKYRRLTVKHKFQLNIVKNKVSCYS